MATVRNSDYEVQVHVQNIKLADLTRCVIKVNGRYNIETEILKINLSELSPDKTDNILEFNRLVSNYTGTLYFNEDKGIDFNKLLPSDLELFSTNTTISSGDDTQNVGDYSKYLRAVYINDGDNDILKIQLIGFDDYFEDEVNLYTNDVLVTTIKYNQNIKRSHLLTLSSQTEFDTISDKLHEREDSVPTTSDSKEFSSGKGINRVKVSDCNLAYIASDSTKNVLSSSYINNHNEYLIKPEYRIVNSSIVTIRNKKYFFGVPKIQE